MAECDALDGLADGILNDPRECPFDVTKLECSAQSSNDRLSPEKVVTA
ncbi:tannase/feruloyl esterase family alpha/beta hydrolase [Ruegeria arenilitoris]|nr:tannase/feruloyl esterase family alpha/beta hydrolase [Ruegeria arenilitoris]